MKTSNLTEEHTRVIETSRHWVKSVVTDLNLCPFAKREMDKNSVRFVVSDAMTEEQLLFDLHTELDRIRQDYAIETTLLIHPQVLREFMEYNAFLSLADALLQQMDLEGVFQIASFHPEYQFAETEADDVENYTNRSPFPILHILREESVERAIASHPDIHSVPVHNRQLMREMGLEKMRDLLRACFTNTNI